MRIIALAAASLLTACTAAETPASSGAANEQAAAPSPQPSNLELRLADGGLTAGQPGLHDSQLFAFGMPRAEVEKGVAAIRGPATGTATSDACGPEPVEFTRFGGLALNFREGKFVGWSLAGISEGAPLKSETGVALGVKREDLGDADRAPATFRKTAEGEEFTAGGLRGYLASDGTVSTILAGETCPLP